MAKANVITNFAPNSPNAAGATKMKIVALEQAFINDRPIAYSASRCECVNAEYTTNETQRVKKKEQRKRKIDYGKKRKLQQPVDIFIKCNAIWTIFKANTTIK